MLYISTRNNQKTYTYKETVFLGIPDDGGLFVPASIPTLDPDIIKNIENHSFIDVALSVATTFIDESSVPRETLRQIITKAFDFEITLPKVLPDLSILELFNGPTSAFKDFGARFMAQILSHFLSKEEKKITILTATSGDTGGAVASAFYGLPNIDVFILYPKDRVSSFQEKQIAGFGGNIHALEIDGSFDDCQFLVKSCFNDTAFRNQINLTSSNSVNFSRLIPQVIYYFEAYRQFKSTNHHQALNIIVPSGNFGNLTGAIYAKKLGLPVEKMIAATNANDVFPAYIESSIWEPQESKITYSNAMDVGNPSNIERIFHIYKSSWYKIKEEINSHSIDDTTTATIISNFYKKYNYLPDPHTAVGIGNYLLESMTHSDNHYIVVSTAHPYKFDALIRQILPDLNIPTNDFIDAFKAYKIHKTKMKNKLDSVKNFILQING